MSRPMTADQFLADVSNHKLVVKLDNGLYRHLMFRGAEDSWNMWFEIVTWPGKLTISGDMGTWTFARLDDMFTFFRKDTLRINADYWSEKLEQGAHGGRSSAKVFSEDLFRKQLLDRVSGQLPPKELRAVTAALQEDVLNRDGEYDLIVAARDFKCGNFTFDEFPDGKEYSYHFLWCLYAIVWGIQQYDAIHVRSEPVEA